MRCVAPSASLHAHTNVVFGTLRVASDAICSLAAFLFASLCGAMKPAILLGAISDMRISAIDTQVRAYEDECQVGSNGCNWFVQTSGCSASGS